MSKIVVLIVSISILLASVCIAQDGLLFDPEHRDLHFMAGFGWQKTSRYYKINDNTARWIFLAASVWKESRDSRFDILDVIAGLIGFETSVRW